MNAQFNEDEIKLNKASESIALNLETLRAEYKKLLIQYKQASLNYVNYLRERSLTENDKNGSSTMVSIPGQAFWGTAGVSQIEAKSLQECEVACANNSKCDGATFNSSKNTCWIRSGKTSVVPASSEDTAIMSRGAYLLSIVEGLNSELLRVNNEILIIINTSRDIYEEQDENEAIKSQTLLKNHRDLTNEKSTIERMLLEYRNLDQTQKDTSLVVYKNYYTFLLLLGIVILVCVLLVKFSVEANWQTDIPSFNFNFLNFDGDLSSVTYFVVFGIAVLTLIIYLYQR